MPQDKSVNSIALDDILAASASGVLRALDARGAGATARGPGITSLDLVRNGFTVDIRIIAGGFPLPWLDKALQMQQQLARGAEGGQ